MKPKSTTQNPPAATGSTDINRGTNSTPLAPSFPGPVESATVAPGGPGTDTLWWRVTLAVSEDRRVVLVGNFTLEHSTETWGCMTAKYSHHEAWERGHRDVWTLAGQYALEKLKPEYELALELELRQALNRMLGFRLVVDSGHMLAKDDEGAQ